MKHGWIVAVGLVLILAGAVPASAQMMGGGSGTTGMMGTMPMTGMMGSGAGPAMGGCPGMGAQPTAFDPERPWITFALAHAKDLGLSDEQTRKEIFKEGKGCVDCNNTGYRGRLGVYEVFPVNAKIRDLILDRAATSAIKKQAVADGMLTLRADALLKLKKGITTAEEVLKETAADR